MGLFKKQCWSNPYSPPSSGNPNPSLFKVLNSSVISGNLVIEAHYPGCTNYEGRKILVYKSVDSATELLRRTGGKLDPHFTNQRISPIARFPPTPDGWAMAERLAAQI